MIKLIAQVLVYEEAECVDQAIRSWVDVCERIDVFEGAFQTLTNLGYPLRSQDGTIEKIHEIQNEHSNVYVTHHHEVNEPVLRNNHMWQTIRDFGDDCFLFILDGDEIYTKDEVTRCIEQVEAERDQFNTWWVNFKNYVGDLNTYYLGFRVPRFFKLDKARGFSGYNDICFDGGVRAMDIRDVLPRHVSWSPVEKAKRKIEWQRTIGWQSSFKIENNQVVLDDEYYVQTGKMKPLLRHDII